MLEKDAADGAEDTNHNDSAEDSNESYSLKSDIETLKSQNLELQNKLNSFLNSQNTKVEESKKLSKAEFETLLKDDPSSAFEYAVENKVKAHTSEIAKTLNAQQQQQFYDQKTEHDFPLLKKDKEFTNLVKSEIAQLIEDGMSKDSPKLVYKAAQIAALKHKGSQQTKSDDNRTMSSEAPSNLKKNTDKKFLPVHFDRFAQMFDMNEKQIARVKENFKLKAERDELRKNRS